VSVSHDSGTVDLPTAFFLGCLFCFYLNVVVLVNPPPQGHLHDVVALYLPVLFYTNNVSPSKVSTVRQPYPRLASVVQFSLAHICGLGLCLFLMRWSVIYCQDG